MYLIKIENSFDSAHFLSNYKGKCANIHGHRWKVEVTIQKEDLQLDGNSKDMVMDFSDFKKDLVELCDIFDHALIVEKGSMKTKTLECLKEEGFYIVEVDFRTTAENFSYYFFSYFNQKGYDVKRVVVYETPNNSAVYEV